MATLPPKGVYVCFCQVLGGLTHLRHLNQVSSFRWAELRCQALGFGDFWFTFTLRLLIFWAPAYLRAFTSFVNSGLWFVSTSVMNLSGWKFIFAQTGKALRTKVVQIPFYLITSLRRQFLYFNQQILIFFRRMIGPNSPPHHSSKRESTSHPDLE